MTRQAQSAAGVALDQKVAARAKCIMNVVARGKLGNLCRFFVFWGGRDFLQSCRFLLTAMPLLGSLVGKDLASKMRPFDPGGVRQSALSNAV